MIVSGRDSGRADVLFDLEVEMTLFCIAPTQGLMYTVKTCFRRRAMTTGK